MLYVIRHREPLEVDLKYIACHLERSPSPWDRRWATLVEANEQTIWKLLTLENVIRIEVARPGRFGDAFESSVIVRYDGTWIEEDEVGALD
ncbi:MAG: hypothetical protein HY331_04395 [Chloroflexi bacterium]|nr:hypothetical protein [Chloroflexota bacterium]